MSVCVAFDLDGTLIDSVPAIIDTLNEIAMEKGSVERFDQEFFRDHTIAQAVRHIGVHLFSVASTIKQYLPLYESRLARVHLFPGVLEVLTALRDQGVLLAVVSTNSDSAVKQVLSRLGLLHLFEVISGGSVFGKHAHLKKIRSQLSIDRLLFVGDETRDILAGHKAGSDTCAVSWGLQSEQHLLRSNPTMMARSVPEFRTLILAWANNEL